MERRVLNDAETQLCNTIFRGSLPADRVRVVRWDSRMGGFTPRMNINCDDRNWRDAYLIDAPAKVPPEPDKAHWFIHELCHAWQFFNGVQMVATFRAARKLGRDHRKAMGYTRRDTKLANMHHGKGFAKRQWRNVKHASVYGYDRDPDFDQLDLMDFTMEQQGDIIADWFALKHWKHRHYQAARHGPAKGGYSTVQLVELEQILANFFANPSYVRSTQRHARKAARRA